LARPRRLTSARRRRGLGGDNGDLLAAYHRSAEPLWTVAADTGLATEERAADRGKGGAGDERPGAERLQTL